MKIEVKPFALDLIKAIGNNSKISIYNNVLISSKKNLVRFMVFDGTTSYSVVKTCKTLEEGDICVSADKFSSIVKDWDREYTISGQEEKATLHLLKSKYTLVGLPSANFPMPDLKAEVQATFQIPRLVLATALNYSDFYSNDTTSPFSSVKFEISDGIIKVVSSDKMLFSYYEDTCEGKASFQISGRDIDTLKAFNNGAHEFLEVKLSRNLVIFNKNDDEVLSILKHGLLYPDITKVFISDGETYTLITDEVRTILKRILNTVDSTSYEVGLTLKEGLLAFHAMNSTSSGVEEIELVGTDFDFLINGANLLKIINKIKSQEFLLTLAKDRSRIQLSDGKVKFLTVPIVRQTVEVKRG